jgi:hypothetical protein
MEVQKARTDPPVYFVQRILSALPSSRASLQLAILEQALMHHPELQPTDLL